MAATGASVLTNFLINFITLLVCWLIFVFLRVSAFARRFYAPRRYAKDIDLKPSRLPNVIFGWAPTLLRYPEVDIIDEVGLDGAIYLRVLTYGMYFFAGATLWCLIVILPINKTDNFVATLMAKNDAVNSTTKYDFSDFDELSLANVDDRSPRMAAHVISLYLLVGFAQWLLWKFSKESVLLRLMFLANSTRGGPSHTVLVTDIPGISEVRAQNVAALKKIARQEAREKKDAAKQKKEGLSTATSKEPTISELDEDNVSSEADGEDPSGIAPTKSVMATAPARSAQSTPAAFGNEARAQSIAAMKERAMAKKNKNVPVVPAHQCPEGLSPEEIEAELMDERQKEKGPPSRRQTKRYNYDLSDTSMDPLVRARRRFAAGLIPHEVVRMEFALVYSDQGIAAVNMVYDQAVLGPLVAEYDAVQMALEDFLSMAEYRLRLRREIELPKAFILNPGKYGEWGTSRYGTKWFQKVDALTFWPERLEELKRLILEEQDKAQYVMAPSAFVTFNSRAAQCTAAAALHCHDELAWKVQSAPAPQELIWGAVGIPTVAKSTSKTLMWILFWLMTIFFMIPVGALQALVDVPKLATVPVLKDIVNAPVIKQLLEAIVPGLVLKIFLAIVPILIAIMMKIGGANSDSEVDFGVVARYFIFQIIVVFIGSTISSSFFSQLQQLIDDPASIVNILGTAIPQAATFFITYIFIIGMGSTGVNFIRAVDLILFWLFSKIAASPRKRERLWSQQYTVYGKTVTQHMLVMLLGFVYCIINPITAAAALLYFAIASVTERYNTIYVYRRTYESAGKLWAVVFNQVMVCIYIMELVMIGLLSVKKFPGSVAIIPLIFISISFHISSLSLYSRPWSVTALHAAAELDQQEAREKMRLLEKKEKEARMAHAAHHHEPKVALSSAGSMSIEATPIKAAPAPASPFEEQPNPTSSQSMPAMVNTEVEDPDAQQKLVTIPPLTDEEKAEIAEMYKSPVFKVELEDVERLVAQSKSVRERIVIDVNRRIDMKALTGDAKAIALKKEREEAEAAEKAHQQAELAHLEAEDFEEPTLFPKKGEENL